jgi:hypothetical protein
LIGLGLSIGSVVVGMPVHGVGDGA